MEHKIDRHRRLADYIYNDLGTDGVLEIEREISTDPEFSESYRLNMHVKEYLQAKIQLEEMRSDPQLENAEKLADMAFEFESQKEHDVKSNPVVPPGRSIWKMTFTAAIAATVTIIIAIGLIPPDIDQDRLFDRYYEPIEASDFSQRGELNEMYRDIADGINNYRDGNYRQSIDQFRELSSDPAIKAEVHFFTGLSYLGLGEYRLAQNNLELIADGNSRYQAETLWYLSLCYLKSGEFEKATTLLGQLEMYDGLYKKDTQALLKKLRRFI